MRLNAKEELKTISISLPLKIVREFDNMAKRSKTTRNNVLKEALNLYLENDRLWEQIYKWGEESAKKLGISDEDDIDKLIHE